jgi:hypothetical protein
MRRFISLVAALALACLVPVIPASAQTGPMCCNQVGSAFPTSATTTSVISPVGTGSGKIAICGYMLQITAGTGQLVSGTGSSCTSPTQLSPVFAAGVVGSDPSPTWRGLGALNGQNVCVVTGTGTTSAQVFVFYSYQ